MCISRCQCSRVHAHEIWSAMAITADFKELAQRKYFLEWAQDTHTRWAQDLHKIQVPIIKAEAELAFI